MSGRGLAASLSLEIGRLVLLRPWSYAPVMVAVFARSALVRLLLPRSALLAALLLGFACFGASCGATTPGQLRGLFTITGGLCGRTSCEYASSGEVILTSAAAGIQ